MNGQTVKLKLSNNQNIIVLAFIIVLYAVRNAVPYIFFPLFSFITIYVVWTLIFTKNRIHTIKESLKALHPFFFLAAIELIALATAIPYGDNINIVKYAKEFYFYICYFYLISTHICNKADLSSLIKYISRFFFWFACAVSILSIIKYLYAPDVLVPGDETVTIFGTSLVSDYNFFSLFLINAIILNLYEIFTHKEKKHWIAMVFAIAIMFWVALLSTSKRGMFMILLLYAILLVPATIPCVHKMLFKAQTYFRNLLFVVSATIILMLSYCHITTFQSSEQKIANALSFDTAYIEGSNITSGYRFNIIFGKDLIKIKPKNTKYDSSQENSYNENILKNIEGTGKLVESRKIYWKISLETLHKYSIFQIIIGTGYKYLQDFYNHEYNLAGHPHFQPFAIILMSGIIGFVLWLALISYVTYIYVKNIRKDYSLAYLFAVNFTFGLFSFSNFFGASFLLFLIIIPYMYNYFERREKETGNAN